MVGLGCGFGVGQRLRSQPVFGISPFVIVGFVLCCVFWFVCVCVCFVYVLFMCLFLVWARVFIMFWWLVWDLGLGCVKG